MEQNVDPWDDEAFLRLSLSHLGLEFRDWSKLKYGGNTLEIVDKGGRQFFRNLNFMELSSYTLLESLTFDASTLFYRSKDIQDLINIETSRIFRGELAQPDNIPEHSVVEILSTDRTTILVKIINILPVYSSDRNVAGVLFEARRKIISAKAKILNKRSKEILARIFSDLGFG